MPLAKYQRRSLALIRSRILLERATINFTREQLDSIREKPFATVYDGTDETREAMRLYVDTWIVPVIDDLLAGTIPYDSHEGQEALEAWEREQAEKDGSSE